MLLVGVGSLVGVAGMILTNIMCKSMNRSLAAVLGGFKTGKISGQDKEKLVSSEKSKKLTEGDIPSILNKAKKVIIIPGYGMALAQAQMYVKELLDILEKEKKDVDSYTSCSRENAWPYERAPS
jgi:NAD(P) transhydrogenase subunit beta